MKRTLSLLILVIAFGIYTRAQTQLPAAAEKTPAQRAAELKLSDLPEPAKTPDDVPRCGPLLRLVDDKLNVDVTPVSDDILNPLLDAAQRCASECLKLTMQGPTPQDRREMMRATIRSILVMDAASSELHRREYNALVDRFNSLNHRYSALLEVAQRISLQLDLANAQLSRERQINSVLEFRSLLTQPAPAPLIFLPPPPPRGLHCTSARFGNLTTTDCQ